MHPWHDISVSKLTTKGQTIPAVIEIPKGSKNKYELDKDTGILRLDRVLYSSVNYPANYGFIPQTLSEDGDPLDILVIGQTAIDPLILVDAVPIGLMKMRDDKGIDDKIIAVCASDPAYNSITSLKGLPAHTLNEIKRFFLDYKTLEKKEVLVDDFLGVKDAIFVINCSLFRYLAYIKDTPK